jgi:prepilin-type N-terminal cleavage/methylation domain-containing protein
MKPRHPSHGFTLTELLVAAAILAALAALVVPVARYALGRARASSCLGQLRSIGVALESWLQDHNDRMPELEPGRRAKSEDIPVLENTLTIYLTAGDAFRCPADHGHFDSSGSSYLWNSTQSGRHKMQLEFFGAGGDPHLIPLVTDKEAWHPGKAGINILYADYRVTNELRFQAGP